MVEEAPFSNSAEQIDQPEKKQIIRRAPAIPTNISNLQEGGRVCVMGTCITKNPDINSFVIDDGQNKVLVLANNQEGFEQVKEGQGVRVMGKVWGEKEEVEIQADIIQDFAKIDRELYNKVFFE